MPYESFGLQGDDLPIPRLSHRKVGDTNAEFAEFLERLNADANGGRGVETIRTIVMLLRRGNEFGYFEHARSIYSIDGDKIRSYPTLVLGCLAVFGCRTHGTCDCQDDLCNSIMLYALVKLWDGPFLAARDGTTY